MPRRARCSAARAGGGTRSGPRSIVNISGMSFGSLSGAGRARRSTGARAIAGCLQNTGEGGISPHHCHGGELICQIGTGYFGCRDAHGRFSLAHLLETIAGRAGAGDRDQALAGREARASAACCRRAKVTPEIAAIRGVRVGRDCVSPPGHSRVRRASTSCSTSSRRSPTRPGCRSGSSRPSASTAFWDELARADGARPRPRRSTSSPIDGGEGGTGAAPLVFTDHVALPFKLGFAARLRGLRASRGRRGRRVHRLRASSASPRPRCSRSRSAATWSTSAARR